MEEVDLNECSKILREIEEITFPKLAVLYLNNNNIDSFEAIHRINFPSLTYLDLGIVFSIQPSITLLVWEV